MQEFTSPSAAEVDPSENLTTSLWRMAAEHADLAILASRDGAGPFVDVTYAEMASKVKRIAAGLMSLGLEKGDRVCIFMPTRIEFTLLDYAIWAAGYATVTIYETSSAEQVEWIVGDSGAKAIVCADDSLVGVFNEKAGKLGTCEHVFSVDSGGLDALIEAGSGIGDDAVIERAKSVGQDDLATLVYTSGTTGMPKGCVLTVRNFVFQPKQVLGGSPEIMYPGASTLMFLPLAHIFARVVQVASIMSGAKIAYSTGIPQLMAELQMVRPTWLFSVPRVFEKVYNGAQQKAHGEGKGKIFDKAAETAIAWSRSLDAGKTPLGLKLSHGLFDKLVYSKLRAALGGRAEYALSGGAALGERLGHFYRGIGINILEGYGLTETTAGSTIGRPTAMKIGAVGQPVAGTSVKIAEDGEVMLKGEHIFTGYWKNDAATKAAIEPDGWFHSGDIGELDDEGYLRITGRKKELIVTSGGKNVAPNVLEDRMRAHPLVSQCMVVGDAKPFIGALVTIDAEQWPNWAAANGKSGSVFDNVNDPDLRAAIQKVVDDANNAVSKAEAIKEFRILPVDFTIEGGELTPTLKVKRGIVANHFEEYIDSIYAK